MLLNKKRFERASPPCSYLFVLSLIRLSCQEPYEDSPLHAREKIKEVQSKHFFDLVILQSRSLRKIIRLL